MKIILCYAAAWLGLVALAILNGFFRERGYGPGIPELAAHQLSTCIGTILFGLYIWTLTGICRIKTSGQAIVIGGLWLIMTVLFEFIFGHYVIGHSWNRLLANYNLFEGRLWVLIVVWTAGAPYLFYRLRS